MFFESALECRAWLEVNHISAKELMVGFRKVGTGLPSMTWPESVDEALCFGWIDGVRKRIGEATYQIRFSPRKKGSIWSLVNVGKVGELVRQNRMHPMGIPLPFGRGRHSPTCESRRTPLSKRTAIHYRVCSAKSQRRRDNTERHLGASRPRRGETT